MQADITIRDAHGCCDVLTRLEQLITANLIATQKARIWYESRVCAGYADWTPSKAAVHVDLCNRTVAFVDAAILPIKLEGEVEIGGYFADWHARLIVDSIEESGDDVVAVYEIASGRL